MTNVLPQSEDTARILADLRLDEARARDELLTAYRMLDALAALILEHPDRRDELIARMPGARAAIAERRVAYERAAAEVAYVAAERADSGTDDYLSVSAAATYSGISRQTLHSAIRAGRLTHFSRIERGKPTTYVFRRDVDRYKEARA